MNRRPSDPVVGSILSMSAEGKFPYAGNRTLDNVKFFSQNVVGDGLMVMYPTLYANIISKPAFVVYVQCRKGNCSTRGCVVTRRVRDGND